MTAPNTRPEQVSNTKTLLPAWTFARVNIWASVSYRRWLHHTKNTSYIIRFSLPDNFSHKLCALTHQIFAGSRPWYIIARMRHDGLRIVTVFSYLEKHKIGTTDDKNDSKLNGLQETLDFVSRNYSLFLFLLDVLILGISSLILECWAVIYKLLNDFLWSTYIDILSNEVCMTRQKPNNASLLKRSLTCLYILISTKPSDSYLYVFWYVLKEHFTQK